MAVNPKHLADHVTDALKQFCDARVADPSELAQFQEQLGKDFSVELKTSSE